jgi:hypothetical protein
MVPSLEEDVDVITAAYGEDNPRALRATMKLAGNLRAAGRADGARSAHVRRKQLAHEPDGQHARDDRVGPRPQ